MNTSDLLKLIDAGFTKAEIEAMTETPEIKEEPKIEELKEEPEKNEEPEQKKDDQFSEAVRMMTEELKAMRSDFQKHLLNSDDMKISNPLEESEKILASIIDPPKNKKKGK